MMIALLILSVILSAVAASLINFSRQSVVNERRVQATAYLSQLHETYQTLNWDLAGLYDTEIATDFTPAIVAEVGDLDVSDVDAPTYEDEPLVLFAECVDGDCNRDELVPRPVDTTPTPIDDREFDRVITVVTWVTDDPDLVGSQPLAKRFVTYVSWSVLGRSYVQRFESLRSPTAGEIEDFGPPEITSFEVNPSTVQVDPATGLSSTAISVIVRFSSSMMDSEVVFPCYEVTPEGEIEVPAEPCIQELEAKPGTEGTEFEGTITLPDERIWLIDEEGDERKLQLIATEFAGDPPLIRFADLDFVDASVVQSPSISSLTLNPQQVDVRVQGPNERLCSTVTVTATISGLDPADGTVSITWPGKTSGVSGAMTNIVGNTWERQFASGSPSPWGSSGSFSFTVIATNPGPDGELAVQDTTDALSVTPRTTGPGC